MSKHRQDIEKMLRRNVEQQLGDFDWDRLHGKVLRHLAMTHPRPSQPARISYRNIAAAAVVAVTVLLVALGYMCRLHFDATDRGPTGRTGAVVEDTPAESDDLLASADPETILLAGHVRLLALNDPLLAPHSVWDQEPVEESSADRITEKKHEDEQI